MATHEIVIAGFGGQGILFLGEVLARAALHEGRHVTWLPAYGPEQRGGTANCTVVIGDHPIASPVVADPSLLIVLNRPSLDRFEPRVRRGGLIALDRTMVDRAPIRADVDVVAVPATAIAGDLGSSRAANIVLLGAVLALVPVVSVEAARIALDGMVHDVEVRARNVEALERGAGEARRTADGRRAAPHTRLEGTSTGRPAA
jgi:2-oxoglutarate ferredoxin oxidoreductase subunit gamma